MVTVYRQHHLVALHLLALNYSQLIPQLFIRNYMSLICLISNPLGVEISPLPLFLSVVLASWHRTGGTVYKCVLRHRLRTILVLGNRPTRCNSEWQL